MNRVQRFLRSGWLALLAGLFVVALAPAARAQDCNTDLNKLGQARMNAMNAFNKLIADAKGKPLDPGVACEKSRAFISADNAFLAYLTKNKDWCQIPDDMIKGDKAGHDKSAQFSAKACQAAAQRKQMEEQAASGGLPSGPPPLPTGPL